MLITERLAEDIHKIISIKPYLTLVMTQKSKIYRKSALKGRGIRNTNIGTPIINEYGSVPISTVGKPIKDSGMPPFHVLNKKDIEKELSKIENKFGMTPEDFHKA